MCIYFRRRKIISRARRDKRDRRAEAKQAQQAQQVQQAQFMTSQESGGAKAAAVEPQPAGAKRPAGRRRFTGGRRDAGLPPHWPCCLAARQRPCLMPSLHLPLCCRLVHSRPALQLNGATTAPVHTHSRPGPQVEHCAVGAGGGGRVGLGPG